MASFFTLCVCACLCVFLCLYLFALSQKNLNTAPSSHMLQPPVCCSQWAWFTTRTHTSTTGQDHKSKASSLLAAKKTQGCFSPTKRAINSVSQGITHSSGPLYMARIAHTAHLPLSRSFSNRICVDSWPRYTVHSIKSVGTHLFNTTASTALGSLPALYWMKKFSSSSVDLSNNKSYNQLVTEYGYLHQFSQGQSQCTSKHQFAFSISTSPSTPCQPLPPSSTFLHISKKIDIHNALYIKFINHFIS